MIKPRPSIFGAAAGLMIGADETSFVRSRRPERDSARCLLWLMLAITRYIPHVTCGYMPQSTPAYDFFPGKYRSDVVDIQQVMALVTIANLTAFRESIRAHGATSTIRALYAKYVSALST
ncbi:hypothetical protein MN608_04770 [Microdochium nivale]|nr:hypothetical protein MN608_04770 [Microdochium nivale]